MKTRIALSISILSLSLAVIGPLYAKEPCMDWARVMARQETGQPQSGIQISLGSFENFTKMSEDTWMSAGIRDYLADLLKSSNGLIVYTGTSASGGISGLYTVSGSFQHMGDQLRVFIRLSDEGGAHLLRQYEAVFPYPDNREFFVKLSDIAQQMMNLIKVPHNSDIFDAVRNATESTSAYEAFSRGRQILASYDPKNLEVAKKWFEGAKSLDYRSPLGYEGMIDLYVFLGFYNKQLKLPNYTYYQLAEAEMAAMARLAKPAPLLMTRKKGKVVKKEGMPSPNIENPFIQNNISYQAGMQAMQMGNYAAAAAAFKKATEVVPEDAISWYYLSSSEARAGNTAASTYALRKAYEMNPCVE